MGIFSRRRQTIEDTQRFFNTNFKFYERLNHWTSSESEEDIPATEEFEVSTRKSNRIFSSDAD
ncbi:hypothetical protein M569_10164 [Genlisea aurea]|uniref:Uncharacterized protein n=1 Tax=Genlisea aurea TaxID=192259 RepID=S8DNM3_9LAMI|nr:hypothetical protein M569_10164 [Genlisea aurea]